MSDTALLLERIRKRLEGKEHNPSLYKSHKHWVNSTFQKELSRAKGKKTKKNVRSGAAVAPRSGSTSVIPGLERTLKSFPSPAPHYRSLIQNEHNMEEWFEALLLAHICNPHAKYPLPGIRAPFAASTIDVFGQHFQPEIAEIDNQRNFRIGRYDCFDGLINVNHTLLTTTEEMWVWVDPLDIKFPLRICEWEGLGAGTDSLSPADILISPGVQRTGISLFGYPWSSNPHTIRSSDAEYVLASPQPHGMTSYAVDPDHMTYVGGVTLDAEITTQTAFTQTAMIARSDTLMSDRFLPGFASAADQRNGDYGETQSYRQALNGAARFSGTKWGQTRLNTNTATATPDFYQFSINNAIIGGYPFLRVKQTLGAGGGPTGVTVSFKVGAWTGVSPLNPEAAGALANVTVPFVTPEWFQYANATGAVTQESALAQLGAISRSVSHVGVNHTGKTEIGRTFKEAVQKAGPKETIKAVIGKGSHPATSGFVSALKTAGRSAAIWAVKKAGEYALEAIPAFLV